MRAAVLFVLGVLLGACVPQKVATDVPAHSHVSVVSALAAQTVALVHRNEEGAVRPYCSGVWVSQTSILTAAHCTSDETLQIEHVGLSDVFAPGDLRQRSTILTHSCSVYALDQAHDLALCRDWTTGEHEFAHTSLDGIRAGAFAQTMGHSLGLWWSYSNGTIAAVRSMDVGLDMLWIQATAPISPGNSGGGLFDEQGHLIGIASRQLRSGQNLNLFVHAQYIDALLRGQVYL